MSFDLVVEGKVVLPDAVEECQVGVRDGVIAEVKKQGLKGERVIRAGDSLVFPGFVDSHVHLRDPGWTYKEDMRTGTMASVHGGVTTVLDMPNNPIPTTSLRAIEEKQRIASQKAVIDVKFFAGVVPENIREIPALKEGVVGFKAYLGKSTGGMLVTYADLKDALPLVARTARPLCLHCEDQDIIDRHSVDFKDRKGSEVYADMRPPESEIECVRRVADSVKDAPGSRVNICHASTRETLGIVSQSAGAHLSMRCEAALHHIFFNRNAMSKSEFLRTNPPLRSEEDRSGLLAGLRDGRVEALVTDHAPHTRTEKVKGGLAGVPGLDDYGHVVSWLLRTIGLDPLRVAQVCSSSPAEYYGMNDRGRVATGRRADLTIIDLHSPEKVNSESLQTKCGWTPYEGLEFPGRVRWTIGKGRILLDDFEMGV